MKRSRRVETGDSLFDLPGWRGSFFLSGFRSYSGISENREMTIRVLFFAQCSDIVGSRELEIEAAQGSTVQDLVKNLVGRYPRLARLERSIMLSVNQQYVEGEQILNDGDEVALITPVSGG